MQSKGRVKIYILPILFVALLTALDQLTKYIVRGSFVLHESRPLIQDVFHLTYVQNEGAAWGMFAGKRIVFLIITVVALGFCGYVYHNAAKCQGYRLLRVCLVFLMAGAIGNMIDRIELSYVVDFLDFTLINFPVFNVADIYVTCSVILILILCLFVYKKEDLDILLGEREEE